MKQFVSLVFASVVCLLSVSVFANTNLPKAFGKSNQSGKKQTLSSQVSLSDNAFTGVTQSLFPLKPEQVHTIRRLYNQSNQANSFTEDTPPRPTSSALVVDLSPGATPPVIRLSAGYVSSLVFLDQSGAPWPIKAYDIGDPQMFNILSNSQEENMKHLLLIQPKKQYKSANIAVMLKGASTPVMLTLLSGQRAADYRVDIHVPGMGPLAQPMTNSMPLQADDSLVNVLNQIAPDNSKRIEIQGGNAEAWLQGDRLYVRTPLTIISPGWVEKMSSSDQTMHAYSLRPTSVLLALRSGKTLTLNVKGL